MNVEFFFNGWQCSSLVVPIFSDLWATYLQHGVEKTFTISFLFLKMHCLWCGRESILIFLFPFRRRTPKSISDKIYTVVSKVYSQYKIKLYNNIDGRRLSTHNDQLLILWFRKPTKSFYVDDLWWKLYWNLVKVSVFYLWSFSHTRRYSSRTKATNGVVYTCNIDNADNGSIFGAPWV